MAQVAENSPYNWPRSVSTKMPQTVRRLHPFTWVVLILYLALIARLGLRGETTFAGGGSASGPSGSISGVWEYFDHGWPCVFLRRELDETESSPWSLWRGDLKFRPGNLLCDVVVWLIMLSVVGASVEYWMRRRRNRKFWQWSLSSMFLAGFLSACVLGWWRFNFNQYCAESTVLAAVSDDVDWIVRGYSGPVWLRRLVNTHDFTAFDRVRMMFLKEDVDDPRLASLVPHLTTFRHCKTLRLQRAAITDDGIACLAELDQVEWLDLAETSIGDRAIAVLKDFSHLRVLDLYGTEVTDDALSDLCSMRHLRQLDVGYTKLSDEGLRKLEAALPNTLVTH